MKFLRTIKIEFIILFSKFWKKNANFVLFNFMDEFANVFVEFLKVRKIGIPTKRYIDEYKKRSKKKSK